MQFLAYIHFSGFDIITPYMKVPHLLTSGRAIIGPLV